MVRAQLGIRTEGDDIDPANPLDLPETGPVFHIITPRRKMGAPVAEPYHIRKLYHRDPLVKGAADTYERIFGRMETIYE